MATKNDSIIVENVGGVGEPYSCEDVVPNTSSLDMKNVCLETTNLLENEVLQLVATQAQVVFWKPHHQNSICWVFLLLMMIYMWLLKFCKCCDALFINQKKWQVIFCPKM
jgi:hypothetical protein